jgi:WD40 repeat protein
VLTHPVVNCRVRSVAWTLDGTKIASASDDKTIKVWNAQMGQCVSTLSGHSDSVNAVSWRPDGTVLASGSVDKTIKLWDTQSGQVKWTLRGHRYTLFLCFGTNNLPNCVLFSSDWGGVTLRNGK